MLRIVYDGIELDIDENADLFLSYEGANLLELGTRADVFNNVWSMPQTARNRKVFGVVDLTTADLGSVATYKKCQVYTGTALVVDGFARVIDVKDNKFGLLVVGSIGGVSAMLDNPVASVDLGTDLPLYNTYAIQLSWTPDELDNVCYPFFNNGFAQGYTGGDNEYPIDAFRPYVRFRWFVATVLEKLGYTVLDEEPDTRERLTYLGGMLRHGSNVFPLQKYKAEVRNYVVPPQVGPLFLTNLVPLVPVGETTLYTTSGGAKYQVPADMVGLVRIRLNAEILTTSTGTFTVRVQVFRDFQGTVGEPEWVEIVLNSSVTTRATTTIDVLTVYDPTNATVNQFELRTELTTVGPATPRVNITVEFEPLDYLVTDNKEDESVRLTARNFTDMTIKELLLEYCNRFGKVINISESDKTVQFTNLRNLGLIGDAVDWSSKVCRVDGQINTTTYESEFVYGSLAERNWYKSANDVANFSINSKVVGIQPEKDVFTSKLNGYQDSNLLLYKSAQPANSIPQFVPVQDNTGAIVQWSYYDSAVAYSTGDVVYVLSSFYKARIPVAASPLLAPGRRNSEFYWELLPYETIFDVAEAPCIVQLQTVRRIGNTLVRAYTDGIPTAWIAQSLPEFNPYPSFQPLYWSAVLPAYQEPVINALARPRLDKYLLDLTVADVTALDYTKPIRIDGVYYYLNLVDQFDVQYETPTPVDLLQL